jgi:hypothetical protein
VRGPTSPWITGRVGPGRRGRVAGGPRNGRDHHVGDRAEPGDTVVARYRVLGRAIVRFLLPRQFERDLNRSLDNLEDLVAAGLTT